jgi:hypothetical protein
LVESVIHATGSSNSSGLLVVFPSGSLIGLLPSTIGSSQNDNTIGRYLIWGDNSTSDGLRTFKVRYFNMNTNYPGTAISKFGVIFGGNSSQSGTGIDYYLISASGSSTPPNNK